MTDKMTFTDAIVQMAIELAPTFVLLCVIFVILSWLRIAVDAMSGRGL